ncbi:MAG: hypothetical protein HUU35_02570 [Armatimonadetes bacterium]|nr:hypothetical protein [Armatimonadota bacterium]
MAFDPQNEHEQSYATVVANISNLLAKSPRLLEDDWKKLAQHALPVGDAACLTRLRQVVAVLTALRGVQDEQGIKKGRETLEGLDLKRMPARSTLSTLSDAKPVSTPSSDPPQADPPKLELEEGMHAADFVLKVTSSCLGWLQVDHGGLGSLAVTNGWDLSNPRLRVTKPTPFNEDAHGTVWLHTPWHATPVTVTLKGPKVPLSTYWRLQLEALFSGQRVTKRSEQPPDPDIEAQWPELARLRDASGADPEHGDGFRQALADQLELLLAEGEAGARAVSDWLPQALTAPTLRAVWPRLPADRLIPALRTSCDRKDHQKPDCAECLVDVFEDLAPRLDDESEKAKLACLSVAWLPLGRALAERVLRLWRDRTDDAAIRVASKLLHHAAGPALDRLMAAWSSNRTLRDAVGSYPPGGLPDWAREWRGGLGKKQPLAMNKDEWRRLAEWSLADWPGRCGLAAAALVGVAANDKGRAEQYLGDLLEGGNRVRYALLDWLRWQPSTADSLTWLHRVLRDGDRAGLARDMAGPGGSEGRRQQAAKLWVRSVLAANPQDPSWGPAQVAWDQVESSDAEQVATAVATWLVEAVAAHSEADSLAGIKALLREQASKSPSERMALPVVACRHLLETLKAEKERAAKELKSAHEERDRAKEELEATKRRAQAQFEQDQETARRLREQLDQARKQPRRWGVNAAAQPAGGYDAVLDLADCVEHAACSSRADDPLVLLFRDRIDDYLAGFGITRIGWPGERVARSDVERNGGCYTRLNRPPDGGLWEVNRAGYAVTDSDGQQRVLRRCELAAPRATEGALGSHRRVR